MMDVTIAYIGIGVAILLDVIITYFFRKHIPILICCNLAAGFVLGYLFGFIV